MACTHMISPMSPDVACWHLPGQPPASCCLLPVPQLVFTEVGLGAVVLTINVILLGGEIVFFQALCLLGYCLFPICVSSIICAAVQNKVRAACCEAVVSTCHQVPSAAAGCCMYT
jgi:hypothetical protein